MKRLIFHTLLSAAYFLQICRVPHQVWVLHIKFGCFRITFRCFATDFTISHQIWPFCMPCVLFPVCFPFVSRLFPASLCEKICFLCVPCLASLIPVRFPFVSRRLTCADLLHTQTVRTHFPFISRSFPAKLTLDGILTGNGRDMRDMDGKRTGNTKK